MAAANEDLLAGALRTALKLQMERPQALAARSAHRRCAAESQRTRTRNDCDKGGGGNGVGFASRHSLLRRWTGLGGFEFGKRLENEFSRICNPLLKRCIVHH